MCSAVPHGCHTYHLSQFGFIPSFSLKQKPRGPYPHPRQEPARCSRGHVPASQKVEACPWPVWGVTAKGLSPTPGSRSDGSPPHRTARVFALTRLKVRPSARSPHTVCRAGTSLWSLLPLTAHAPALPAPSPHCHPLPGTQGGKDSIHLRRFLDWSPACCGNGHSLSLAHGAGLGSRERPGALLRLAFAEISLNH